MAPAVEAAAAVGPADVGRVQALADAVLDLAGGARDQGGALDEDQESEDADDDPMDLVRVPAVAWGAVAQDAARLPDETAGHSEMVR